MRQKILIRVVDKGNATQASFVVTFKSELALDDTLQRIMPLLANKGVLMCECVLCDLKLNGIPFQKGQTISYKPDQN